MCLSTDEFCANICYCLVHSVYLFLVLSYRVFVAFFLYACTFIPMLKRTVHRICASYRRFLRELMAKSYYVQTTVNKYRYSGMAWHGMAWSGVNSYGHMNGTAAIQCSLTYWNCYIRVFFILCLSLSLCISLCLILRYDYLLCG